MTDKTTLGYFFWYRSHTWEVQSHLYPTLESAVIGAMLFADDDKIIKRLITVHERYSNANGTYYGALIDCGQEFRQPELSEVKDPYLMVGGRRYA